jgi:ethanolamine utilization protein EutN
MTPALVVGRTHATMKDLSLQGAMLWLVQPVLADDRPDGFPLIAIDAVGAQVGDRVMLTSDGPLARTRLNAEKTPVRWTIIGIADPRSGARP